MKFNLSITIKSNIKDVIDAYTLDKHRLIWDKMIIDKESKIGEQLTEGSQNIIHFKTPNGPQQLLETILENNLPHSLKGLYEHRHMDNTLLTTFNKIDNTQTKLTLQVDYFQVKSFLPKIFMKLFPGQFKKQVATTLEQLKEYLEH